MDLEKLRTEIDKVDNQIAELYVKRMELSREVGITKELQRIPLENTLREKEIISRVTATMPDEIKLYGKQVYETLFSTSKAYPSRLVNSTSETKTMVE